MVIENESVCFFNKYGFCKNGNRCWKKHVKEICEKKECNGDGCMKKHPHECKYFRDYRRCKFSEFCAFDHTVHEDPVVEELKVLKAKLEAVEKEIENKNLQNQRCSAKTGTKR